LLLSSLKAGRLVKEGGSWLAFLSCSVQHVVNHSALPQGFRTPFRACHRPIDALTENVSRLAWFTDVLTKAVRDQSVMF
jgi:hypothetical protein